jgi:GTP cyclohydrolase II
LHSECLTGDVFGSQRCDCGLQLNEAIEKLSEEGGYLLYLRQEGRGIGLYAKIEAYLLQTAGLDTFEANERLGFGDDERNYRCAAEMLCALGVKRIRLLTNNPDKVRQLVAFGIDVVATVPTGVYVNQHNREYLRAKAGKGQHSFSPADADQGKEAL